MHLLFWRTTHGVGGPFVGCLPAESLLLEGFSGSASIPSATEVGSRRFLGKSDIAGVFGAVLHRSDCSIDSRILNMNHLLRVNRRDRKVFDARRPPGTRACGHVLLKASSVIVAASAAKNDWVTRTLGGSARAVVNDNGSGTPDWGAKKGAERGHYL